MSEWIEFETPGAVEHIRETEEVDTVCHIAIRYSKTDGIYDLMTFYGKKYWIFKYSFTSLNEAREKAEELA